MHTNDFVFGCITGYAISGRRAGAENRGWRDREPITEAQGYHDAIAEGDLGEDLRAELGNCEGDFDAEFVGRMLRLAVQQPQLRTDEIINVVLDQYASDAFVDAVDADD